MIEYSIRRMREEDIDRILDIEFEAFPNPWTIGIYKVEINSEFANYIVMLDGADIVGYAGMREAAGEGHITTIAVSKEYRGYGLGKVLLEELLKRAIQYNFYGVLLEVRDSNIVAQNLYKNYGFESIGVRKGYYTYGHEDAIVMWKTILPGDEI